MPDAVNFEDKGKINTAVTRLCPQPVHGHISVHSGALPKVCPNLNAGASL